MLIQKTIRLFLFAFFSSEKTRQSEWRSRARERVPANGTRKYAAVFLCVSGFARPVHGGILDEHRAHQHNHDHYHDHHIQRRTSDKKEYEGNASEASGGVAIQGYRKGQSTGCGDGRAGAR